VQELEDLKKYFPATILELREVRGLGPKKSKQLFGELGVASLSELEYACEENRLLDLKGFGEKTQATILKNVKALMGNRGKVILPVALQEAEEAAEQLAKVEGLTRAELTGEVRRKNEIVSSVDFVVEGDVAALEKAGFSAVADHFEKQSDRGVKIRVFLAIAEDFGSRLLETTGPAEYVKALGTLKPAATEAEAIAAGRAALIPAECRDLGAAPAKLIEESDIRGVFHLHTTWSDGKNSLAEMAEGAVALGYEYLGLSDHSQTAIYARGLDQARVLEQQKEIEMVQKLFPALRIFHGIESDILPDGSLDYPPDFLKNFDFVIASVHGQMKMARAEMTKRICGALKNPATTWLGHWTGRLLLGREGFDFDLDEVMKCAAGEGKSIELNANPYRLDVDWRILPRFQRLGIKTSIHPDAHSVRGLADTKYGVWMARKAGLTPADVINTKGLKEMESWLRG